MIREDAKKLTLSILVIVVVGLCTLGLYACDALTKKGEKCKRNPMPGSQYCWQHGGRVVKTNSIKRVVGVANGKKDDNADRVQCDAITKKGKQCSRLALPGGTKCWQHQ